MNSAETCHWTQPDDDAKKMAGGMRMVRKRRMVG